MATTARVAAPGAGPLADRAGPAAAAGGTALGADGHVAGPGGPPPAGPGPERLPEARATGRPGTQAQLDVDEVSRVAGLFRLLGDPGRVRILFALLEAGELCVSDLCTAVGSPETSVSHALRLLRTAGVVRNRREGRNVFYVLDDAHVRLLLDLSRAHLRHGDPEARQP